MDHGLDSDRAASGPIRVNRPVVVPAQVLVWGPALAGFLAIFPGFLAFVVSNLNAGGGEPVLGPAVVAYGLGFVAILALLGLRASYSPGVTTYAIYADRIEFEEGLLNRRRRTVLLGGITNVQLTEGLLQRTVGAGSITPVTRPLVDQGDGRLSGRAFLLLNVADPVGVYKLIRSLALGGRGIKASFPE